MFQNLKNLQSTDYEEKAWYSTRIKQLVDCGMKKKDAVATANKEANDKPWRKGNV